MSKKWTEAHPGSSAIVDFKEFNAGYNAYKSSFNGDLDRTTLPDDFLTEASVVAGAFHQVKIVNSSDMDIKTDTTTGAAGEWRGPSYTTYNGGWMLIDSINLTKFKDGMCHWEYTFFYYNYIRYSWNTLSTVEQKGIQVRMKWDDVVVFESYKMPQPIGTARLIADFPTTGGNHTASIEIRQVNIAVNDPTGVNIVNVTSPSHLFIGRWR
tara:strand:+ start:13913 stop:14542 length:630 start_codon:yes stop_codon:yes gene_type:complete